MDNIIITIAVTDFLKYLKLFDPQGQSPTDNNKTTTENHKISTSLHRPCSVVDR